MPIVKNLGLTYYSDILSAMRSFTVKRQVDTPDELWLTQHHPVFTQGQAGKPEHIIKSTDIPVIQSDRGGQVTYHGPGQIVLYFLIDIKRRGMGVRKVVNLIENSIIDLLASINISGFSKLGAPGVYVNTAGYDEKIASLGLRVRKGCIYHGVALNVDMDLTPFRCINPCGYYGLKITQIKNIYPYQSNINFSDIENKLLEIVKIRLINHKRSV